MWFWHGVESEFPQCCIFFFMNVWHELDDDVRKSWRSNKVGYVPCPDCLTRIFKEHLNEVKRRKKHAV